MQPAIHIYENSEVACKAVADEIAELIQTWRANGEAAVLGLATGGTPTPLYRELVRQIYKLY